jgi:hypothetical protein
MLEPKWSLRGEYMESCNCDYLCPCIYTNPQEAATHDHCTAVMVFRIDEGHFGETKLDGLKFALVIRSGRVMADGNWIFAGVVEDSANDLQRTALAAIVGGEAGGTPALIRQNLVGDFRGIEFKQIEVHIEGLKRSAAIPDILAFEIEGVASRNRSGDPLYIDNTAHPANRRSPGRRRRTSRVSASTWTSSAKAITGTTLRSPGPPRLPDPPDGSLGVVDHLAGDRRCFPRHLRGENQLPFAGHPGLDRKSIEARVIRRDERHLAGHLGHAGGTHISLGLDDRRPVDRFVVRGMHKANRHHRLAGNGGRRVDHLKTILVRGGDRQRRSGKQQHAPCGDTNPDDPSNP